MSTIPIRESAIEALTSDDVSEMAARYLLIVAPESSRVNYPEIQDFDPSDASAGLGCVTSELLRKAVSNAVARGTPADVIVYHIVNFTTSLVTATLTEAPPQALITAANLLQNVTESLNAERRDSEAA